MSKEQRNFATLARKIVFLWGRGPPVFVTLLSLFDFNLTGSDFSVAARTGRRNRRPNEDTRNRQARRRRDDGPDTPTRTPRRTAYYPETQDTRPKRAQPIGTPNEARTQTGPKGDGTARAGRETGAWARRAGLARVGAGAGTRAGGIRANT